MKRVVLGCLMIALGLSASAEKRYKYRVSLKDKVGTAYSVNQPQTFLSERAIERRNRQQLPVDETDLPVSRVYINELLETGARLVTTSKWNNTVVLEVQDTLLMDKVKEMPFVTGVKKVWMQPDSIPPRNNKRKKEVTNEVQKTPNHYGNAFFQASLHGADSLHAAGFTGQDMHIMRIKSSSSKK